MLGSIALGCILCRFGGARWPVLFVVSWLGVILISILFGGLAFLYVENVFFMRFYLTKPRKE
uniref:Uncharacterized protein n=1 Tax=Anguilla anguilla TaxID=7936 RepID=A0A0E9URJ7_ANGAN